MFIKQLKVIAGISKIVYHRTYDNYLAKILKSNKFYLSSAEVLDVENNLGKGSYYLSTSRTKYSRFTSGNVIITLDGQKLGQRYRAKAVDYWGNMASDNLTEQEDRLWSEKSSIPNAISYIKRIDINIKLNKDNSSLIKIVTESRRNKIPLYLFNSDNDLRLGNIKKSIDPMTVIKGLDNVREKNSYESRTPSAARYLLEWFKYIQALESYIAQPTKETFYDAFKNKEIQYKHKTSNMDLPGSLRADLHNAKNKNPSVVVIFDKLKRLTERRGYLLKDLHKYILDLREKTSIKEKEIRSVHDMTKNLNYLIALENHESEEKLKSFGFMHTQNYLNLYWLDDFIDENRRTDNPQLKNIIKQIDSVVKRAKASSYSFAVKNLRDSYANSTN